MQKKILVIDDEESIRKIMNQILTKAGYEVVLASDGKDAITKLESTTVDLIMLDMNMPKMNGLDFLRYVRKNKITRVPVLMVTGSSDTELRIESYKLGVYDFIKKPEQSEVMLKRIENGIKIGDMINFNQFIKVELMMAQKLQKYLFPAPSIKTDNYEVHIWSRALSDIGGDLYDYIQFRDGRLMFFVADVSGHSIPASLYTAIVKMVFQNALKQTDDPSQVISLMNKELSGNIPVEMFVTMFCGLIDPENKSIKFCNAGHPSPYIKNSGKVEFLEGHDAFVGPIKNAEFRTFERNLQDVESIFIFTDGLYDVTGHKDQPIGKSIVEELMHNNNKTSNEIFLNIKERISSTKVKFTDDCTLMLIDFL